MRAAKRSAETPTDPTQFNSLFGEILDWMLAPLLFLWPISIAVIYNVANEIANLPYDQALAEDVHAIVRQVKIGNDGAIKSLPERGRDLLRYDLVDTIYYQIRGQRGERLSGDPEIPDFRAPKDLRGDTVYFRDTKVNGEEVRVAYQYLRGSNTEAPPAVMVQVAETLGKRANLANRIVAGILLPQFAIIPLAVILVYLGLGRGIAPLNRLQRLIERRRPSDLKII